MIPGHQPRKGFFPETVKVIASSKQDGNQSFRVRGSAEESPEKDYIIVENRRRLLGKIGLELENTALVYLRYGHDLSYADYHVVRPDDLGKGMSVSAQADFHDAIATDQPNTGIFLPLADCYGVAIYDPVRHAAMVSHLGRHSTNVDGAFKSIQFMHQEFGSDPQDVLVWFTPGIGKDSYPMNVDPGPGHHNFAQDPRWQHPGMSYIRGDKIYLNLRAFNIAGFRAAGVLSENIEWANVDTATHPKYPSHSRGADWRFALAMKIESK